MTAEVAVMNKGAIALAADSALTIGPDEERKVLTSADKIFALSKYEPVAAMVYGNANLMGIPWESIIKLYRKDLGNRCFPLIEDYASDILKFIHTHEKLFPEKSQDTYFRYRLIACLRIVVRLLKKALSAPGKDLTDPEKQSITLKAIEEEYQFWDKEQFLKSASATEVGTVRAKYEAEAAKIIDDLFEEFKLGADSRELLLKIVPLTALKCPGIIQFGAAAGLVIAGFGEESFFPALRSFSVNGIFAGHLNYRQEEDVDIGTDVDAMIVPFAQDDQVYSFMHGVDQNYQEQIGKATRAILDNLPKVVMDNVDFLDDEQKRKLRELFEVGVEPGLKSFGDELRQYRLRNFFFPILDLVGSLPKSELAALAESMVNLTSLRRKMSKGTETVAGPIDVAIISKGDGLVWIKRKHYFDASLNHQFFENYHRERQES